MENRRMNRTGSEVHVREEREMYLTGPVYGEEKDLFTGSGKREEKDG